MIALANAQEETYTRVILHRMHICEMALSIYQVFDPMTLTCYFC